MTIALDKDRFAYAFWANAYGPFYKKPQKVFWCEGLNSYWHKNKDFSAKTLGLAQRDTYVCFCSKSAHEVELFIEGFMAARGIVAKFTGTK